MDNLNCLWQRIDFGDKSICINPDKLDGFIKKNRDSLTQNIGVGRYELVVFAVKYLFFRDKMNWEEMGKLEILSRLYRLSATRHLTSVISDNDSEMVILSEL